MGAALSCRFSRCSLTLALVGFALACGTTSDSSSPLASRDAPADAPASIEVRPSAIRMSLEGTATPTAKTLDATGRLLYGWPVTWRSSDSGIVSVGETSGILTARAIGSASIVASVAGLQDSTLVVVAETQSLDIAFSSLSTIGNYACGLEAVTSLAYCWGDNHSGVLGIGDAEWEDRPMLVDAGARRFRSLSVSAYYNCAIEVGTDLPYCWGMSPNGQMTVEAPFGVSIPTLAGGGRVRFSSISAGTYVTCGVEVSTSLGYCWGRGDLVGDGTGASRSTPTLVGGPGSDLRFASISASPGVVCGIARDSAAAYCWGGTASGQLGDGTTTDRLRPTLVAGGAIRFAAISAGESVVCGVEAQTGHAFCWGANQFGQLGDGTVSARLLPTPVASTDLQFSSIDADLSMACAIERATGSAYCWGRNSRGSLGDGSGLDRWVPTRVAGDVRFANVSTGGAGGEYGGWVTCGVEAVTGRGYCWGFDHLVPTLLEAASWPRSKSPADSPMRATIGR
jgi:serine/threonine-protein kinase